jgi:hypothetical protein|tara:strand:+ start:75 stop:305 length:231 start_codon:yes stop_codon:yes gene_type:complete
MYELLYLPHLLNTPKDEGWFLSMAPLSLGTSLFILRYFNSLEEEDDYWKAHSPLSEKYDGKFKSLNKSDLLFHLFA